MAVEMTQRGPISGGTKFGLSSGITAVSNAADGVGSGVSAGLRAANVTGNEPGSDQETPSPVTILLGMGVLLLGLKLLGESEKTSIDPAHIHIGGYNLLTVTVTAIVGISLLKLVFNRWQVPGVTSIVNFV